MARIDDMLEVWPPRAGPLRKKATVPRLDGLPVQDFLNVLRTLEESAEVQEKRILFCWVCNPGDSVLIQTGWAHGGCYGGGQWVLLVKDDNGWRVDGVRRWLS